MLLSYVKTAEPQLLAWIETNVSFPNAMVDRITPATSTLDIEKLKESSGIDDAWPVVCEPFKQWVIEDNFVAGRPAWETVGAQFVEDVVPYEKMKLSLLNAGHSVLGILGALYGYSTIDEAANDADIGDLEGADPNMPWWRIIMFLLLGLIGLPLGADMLVDSAVVIATRFGVSETVIGLTLIAVGTSLPELATTVMAALRKQADVALGNVIGSNMFNLLAIMGIASFVGPIPVDPAFLRFDLWVMLGASVLLLPFVFMRQDITRVWGAALTLLYACYILVVLM
jgi:hypothetical protein